MAHGDGAKPVGARPDVDPEFIVATVRLPFALKSLERLARVLVVEHGGAVRMYQEGEFMVFYLPEGERLRH